MGERIRHRREPSLGLGVVLAVEHGPKSLLVRWAAGIETYHAPSELERLEHIVRRGHDQAA
jgi:hypothetical protein